MSPVPGRKRNEASRQAILEATFALMQENGFSSLSIEGVAARAGVGKTTIYRWWPAKGVLAVEAFLETVEPLIAFPETGSTLDTILRQMQLLAMLYNGPTGYLVREMIGVAQSDSSVRDAFVAGFIEPRRLQAREVLERGMATGELRKDIDLNIALDTLWAPIYYRLLVSGSVIDEAFICSYADIVLRGLKP
ncbi:TetR/AcrR family transcriptional regulator [Pseudomonas sp. 7P_10.2_Bac1]|uniref:TetR/AcrR family transcriptional regulator n=1 Tax=Pseudomonas sp. 7P_10.2_Bac1 TaxID=2971614 RepID=UPI0021C6AAD5|nr:TetR/AcrR family transcriptional regulator [Pseudomonas sp. 7P_10.2_Bac1]MCU1729853.1 TetR/AcrR family transcriptional regulator [Pseudomonas sp. 7P_10.2_Bac1]